LRKCRDAPLSRALRARGVDPHTALEAAKFHEATAGLKRRKAEVQLNMADMQAKVAKAAVPVMSEKAAKTAPLRAT